MRLNITKTEGDVRIPEYRHALEFAIDVYSINTNSFRNDKKTVIDGAIRLLKGYDIDPHFLIEPERNLFALAVSDAWLSENSIRGKKALIDILKLVATGEKEDARYGSLSGRVRLLSEHGFPRGTMFDPDASSNNQYSEYMSSLLKYVEDNTEPNATIKVTEILSDWSHNSKLDRVRKKLSIHSKEDEAPFRVVVLNKTAQEMDEDTGYTSFYISRSQEFMIVFNCNYQEFNSLEHEYAHSQSSGLSRWYQLLLFRGISEALTEGSKDNPHTYPLQREFLNKLFKEHPEYEDVLYKAYVGDEEARTQIFSAIIEDYGLEGFLVFARVAPIDNPKMSGGIGKSIYLEPNQAIETLKQVARR